MLVTEKLRKVVMYVYWLLGLAMLLLWVYVFLVRYQHSGMECSGDLIVKKTDVKHLLYVEGAFIKVCSLLVLFIALLACVGHMLNLSQRFTGGMVTEIEFEI